MGLIVSEVYDALVEAGASPERAKAAAGAVPSADTMATREDIARIEANMATKGDLAKVEANMATKEDLAKVVADMATKEDLAKANADIARIEARLARVEANMVTKEDLARLDKQVAVLRFAVFGFGSTIVGLLVKLAFFP